MRALLLRWLLARELRARVEGLERDVEDRLNAATAVLGVALDFITYRGLREAYEVWAVVERRAAVERAKEGP